MFKKALQTVLKRELTPAEYHTACRVFRRYFRDPVFGLSEKARIQRPYSEVAMQDPCDCIVPEFEEECLSHVYEEDHTCNEERHGPRTRVSIKVLSDIDSDTVLKLLEPPTPPAQSQICDAAKQPYTCPLLRVERDKIIEKHEAATCLQSHWRGYLARSCLKSANCFTPEVLKAVIFCFL